MKVKIDADELCELRNNLRDITEKNEVIARSNRSLLKQLGECHARNVDYNIKCSWKKLEEERNWWRNQAITISKDRDRTEDNIMRQIHVDYDNASWLECLTKVANGLDYEVPE